VEESEAIKMAQLKSYIRGLFWSDKDNIYTANLNNVDDMILVHDINDGLALKRIVTQDTTGFKDGQTMRCMFREIDPLTFMYNNVINDFFDNYSNDPYSEWLENVFKDYTDSTTEEAVVDNEKAVVTITPEVDTLVKVEFYSDDNEYDVTITLTKSDNSTETFVVPADAENPFEYMLDTKRYSGITISWKYNETHSNTVTSYIKT
jgi:hypothetical protein